ncbi:MAG TPA: RNA pyrophosphohydrolase [Gammaproteobacteria bacterium]|nr:RNA pyrophosphohydrolase [Gammaproteobacteria bacterium]
MIDKAGYRYGVGIILVNDNRQVFFAKRIGMLAWQFPQGGMMENETPEQTMYRELKEEIGLNPEDVKILATTRRWLRYRLPNRLVRHYSKPLCIGQKQKWFLLKLVNQDAQVDLHENADPEFDSWAWVSYWYPLRQVVTFKRRVYVMALKEFAKIVLTKRFWQAPGVDSTDNADSADSAG